MALVPSGTYQGWWLKAGTSVDTTNTNLSFWLNGGANGGQTIQVKGETDGPVFGDMGDRPDEPVAANHTFARFAWHQQRTNMTGLQIQIGHNHSVFHR